MSLAASLLILATSFVQLNGHICPSDQITLDLTKKIIVAGSTCEDVEYCYDDPQTGLKECSTCSDSVNVDNILDSNLTTHWISQPGVTAVNLTLDLIQPFQITFIVLKTSRLLSVGIPRKWELHKSVDHGKTFVPWIFLPNHTSLCPNGLSDDKGPNSDGMACVTDHVHDNNTAIISVLNNQGDIHGCDEDLAKNFSYATQIRIVFLEVNVDRTGDVIDPSQIFYAVSDLTVNGICVCNGYAGNCTVDNDSGLYQCECLNGTCGTHCEQCCPLFNNVPYVDYEEGCEECDCSGNADTCEYNETLGRGVCLACQNNTTGLQCEQCLPQHYRHASGSCQPCNCNEDGITDDGQCNEVGQCSCKEGYTVGLQCDHCPSGSFYDDDTTRCVDCQCPVNTSGVQLSCDPFSGQCNCPSNTTGLQCDDCIDNTWGLHVDFGCMPCGCAVLGSIGTDCDKATGQCSCRDGYTGRTCDRCMEVYYMTESDCLPCDCDPMGSENLICHSSTGKCTCKENVEGQRCEQCREGYYNLTAESGCLSCSCNLNGSRSKVCDNVTGQCDCLPGSSGRICIDCKDGFYPDSLTTTCLPCHCSEDGSFSTSCDEDGQCDCKMGVAGKKCDGCEVGYWGYSNTGCSECDCFFDGTDGIEVCNATTGKCTCAVGEGVTGERCTECSINSGHYVIENHTCNACGDCINDIIDGLVLLVNRMEVTMKILVNITDFIADSENLNHLRNATSLVNEQLMKWVNNVTMTSQILGINPDMPSLLQNFSRLLDIFEELDSLFPMLVNDVEDVVKLTQQVSTRLDLLKINASEVYDITNDILDKVTQLSSSLSEGLLQLMQLLTSSEEMLFIITGRNITIVNSTVNEAIQQAEIRASHSLLFEQDRLSDNVTANNISVQLRYLEEFLQQEYSFLLNVTSTINDTSLDNDNLANRLHSLQDCLNTSTTFNSSIYATLGQSDVLHSKLFDEWLEAMRVLKGVGGRVESLNSSQIPLIVERTDQFQETINELEPQVMEATNYSSTLLSDSILILQLQSTGVLRLGENFIANLTLPPQLDFTTMCLDLQVATNLSEEAITMIDEARLSHLLSSATTLNENSMTLSDRVIMLYNKVNSQQNISNMLHDRAMEFTINVGSQHGMIATLQTNTNELSKHFESVSNNTRCIQSKLQKSEDMIDDLKNNATQINNIMADTANNVNSTEQNVIATRSNINTINSRANTLTTLEEGVDVSIKNASSNINDLISRNMEIINELDAFIQSLSDIHNEISKINVPVSFEEDVKPYLSLQPPFGRALTDAVQFETIDFHFIPKTLDGNVLLLYMGPAKGLDEEDDKEFLEGNYMTLFVQNTNGRIEIQLVYKPSADKEAQQIILTGSDLVGETESHIYISRVGSAVRIRLDVRGKPSSMQDHTMIDSGSLLFQGNNRTVYYVGGKPSNTQIPELVNSFSHYSGDVLLLRYNDQLWGLWDVRSSSGIFPGPSTKKRELITTGNEFPLSFTGDGYLFTESFLPEKQFAILTIILLPHSTDGLAMFAFDEKDNSSLEISFKRNILYIVFNGATDHVEDDIGPGNKVVITIIYASPSIFLRVEVESIEVDRITLQVDQWFTDYTVVKSWFGGIGDRSPERPMITEEPFYGCIEVRYRNAAEKSLVIDQNHFLTNYIYSSEQQRLSLTCLDTVFVSLVSFNGSAVLEYNRVLPLKNSLENNNDNFNSFSLEFTTNLSTTSLFYIFADSTESMSVILVEGVVNVTLSDGNGGNKYLIGSGQLEAGVAHNLLIHLNYTAGYQLFIDNQLEDNTSVFTSDYRLKIVGAPAGVSPRLILGGGHNDQLPNFVGCMKNFAIQFRPISFLGQEMVSHYPPGVTYHKCIVLEQPPQDDDRQPLLALVTAEPNDTLCPLPSFHNFTKISGTDNCFDSDTTQNLSIEAIPERRNGLLLALVSNTSLVYGIGVREGKGVYYINDTTRQFSEECPSLITVDVTEDNDVIIITGSAAANITKTVELTVYIGGLPKDKLFDDNIQSQFGFIQCNSCDGPPGFSGLLSVHELDINSLVTSNTKQNHCIFNT
ncbi:laminin-like protein lam-2 isoform X2 [Dysidea avara]|uniref:laminin-like protein lam-2 isoform X2 n=1 Tax=Dysidea avara TaxID=196820 RepID=UPI003319EBC2